MKNLRFIFIFLAFTVSFSIVFPQDTTSLIFKKVYPREGMNVHDIPFNAKRIHLQNPSGYRFPYDRYDEVKELVLEGNDWDFLHEIPHEVYEMDNLEILKIRNTNLAYTDSALNRMNNLRVLDIAFNDKTHMNLSALTGNEVLETLSINGYAKALYEDSIVFDTLAYILRDVSGMPILPNLRELNIYNTWDFEFPYGIKWLENLEVLYIETVYNKRENEVGQELGMLFSELSNLPSVRKIILHFDVLPDDLYSVFNRDFYFNDSTVVELRIKDLTSSQKVKEPIECISAYKNIWLLTSFRFPDELSGIKNLKLFFPVPLFEGNVPAINKLNTHYLSLTDYSLNADTAIPGILAELLHINTLDLSSFEIKDQYKADFIRKLRDMKNLENLIINQNFFFSSETWRENDDTYDTYDIELLHNLLTLKILSNNGYWLKNIVLELSESMPGTQIELLETN